MKCLCIGICQLKVIIEMLKTSVSFTDLYDEILVYQIFELSVDEMHNIITNIVPNMDLVISQPVSRSYKNNEIYSTAYLKKSLNKKTKHIIIPNCYFTGYDPLPFQLVFHNNETVNNTLTYYPLLCLKELIECDIKNATKKWCDPEAYTLEILNKNVQNSLTKLRAREKQVFEENYGVDIIISDYIEHNYTKQFLFHTYNHPTNKLLIILAKRILTNLCLPCTIEEYYESEFLDSTSLPPAPCVYLKLKMQFMYPNFVLNNRIYDTYSAMNKLNNHLIKHYNDDSLYQKWMNIYKEKLHELTL